ncbi:hypothetical protein [Acinetobacter guerrae]|uniref:hypothetical protein n=1 Tax=Acinetobacter guerrae TaxID=1843371 RepID=UPI00128B66B2|nr:hypothetical protein [Acinetobacter guerrae]MPW45517.1 hypothetical protein [Acinetobacter guerrae]
MIKILFTFLTFFFISSVHAQNLSASGMNDHEINLKNFGFTYCLTKSNNQGLIDEASLAMGGYFQNGSYDENAYKNIKNFIDQGLLKYNRIYKSTGSTSIMMNCLNLYNSSKYDKIIKNQKIFFIN